MKNAKDYSKSSPKTKGRVTSRDCYLVVTMGVSRLASLDANMGLLMLASLDSHIMCFLTKLKPPCLASQVF